jgi:outer membrane lipoprotein LolB
MTRVLRGAALALVALALGACAGQGVRPTPAGLPEAEAEAHQAARDAALARHPQWSLQGRVAVSTAGHGGSGRIDWQQDGPRYQVSLSAPVTRQSWRLTGGDGEARLEGLDGGPRTAADAAGLLRGATGWDIPVDALGAWARGARAASHGPAQVEYGADGQLATLRQDGWTLHYADWQPQAGLDLPLPHRLEAIRGDARVRLAVDAWSSPESP